MSEAFPSGEYSRPRNMQTWTRFNFVSITENFLGHPYSIGAVRFYTSSDNLPFSWWTLLVLSKNHWSASIAMHASVILLVDTNTIGLSIPIKLSRNLASRWNSMRSVIFLFNRFPVPSALFLAFHRYRLLPWLWLINYLFAAWSSCIHVKAIMALCSKVITELPCIRST